MLPAWCHLCWHLELTARKALFSCWKPLPLLRASSLTPAYPISLRRCCLWCTRQYLLVLFTERSPLQSSYPNPHISSTSPPRKTNRLLCKAPGLQLSGGFSEWSGVGLHWCTLFTSHFWWERSWSAGTGHVWNTKLDMMTFRSLFQPICFYQPKNFRKCWLSWKFNLSQTREQWSHRSYFLWCFQAGKNSHTDKYTTKELVLLVGCWCIYSCTFIRKLLLYQ